MCYYNGVKVTRQELIRLMKLEAVVKDIEALNRKVQNGFEYGDYPVVKPKAGGAEISVEQAQWGLLPDNDLVRTKADIPAFRKEFLTLNARGEKLLSSPFYKDAALNRRCLVLSSGFYDWRHFRPRHSKKEEKYPYYVTVPGRSYFFMAGIWQPWQDRETGERIDTFSVVTTEANSLMALVHNKAGRMPTILPEELAVQWIGTGLSERRITKLATYQFPAEEMQAYPVRKDFLKEEEPSAPYEYPELPPLGQESLPDQPTLF